MAKESLPFWPVNTDNLFAASMRMSDAKFGVYVRLLLLNWMDGEQVAADVAMTASTDRNDSLVHEVLADKFDQSDTGWSNERVAQDRAKTAARVRAGSKGGKAKQRRKEQLQEVQQLPLPFDSARFAEAWAEFVQHRIDIGAPMTERAASMQLRQLQPIGETRSVVAIEHTIANGWKGIREPEAQHLQPSPKPGHKKATKQEVAARARFRLINEFGMQECRDWSDQRCIDEMSKRLKRPPDT